MSTYYVTFEAAPEDEWRNVRGKAKIDSTIIDDLIDAARDDVRAHDLESDVEFYDGELTIVLTFTFVRDLNELLLEDCELESDDWDVDHIVDIHRIEQVRSDQYLADLTVFARPKR